MLCDAKCYVKHKIPSYSGTVLQFCTYKYPTLKELVDTFDFAHIQIGAAFSVMHDSNTKYYLNL